MKIGDRVKFVDKKYTSIFGTIGTVQDVRECDNDKIFFILFDGKQDIQGWYERRLEVVSPSNGFDVVTEQPAEKSRVGDTGSARKMDDGKAPLYQGFDKYFPRAKWAVAMVSEYGDRKYSVDGIHYSTQWCAVPNGFPRYFDAEARHVTKAEIEGPYDDGDSGLPHLAQEAWNTLAKLERAIKDGLIEVRRGNDIVDGKPILGTARAVKL